MLQARGTYRKSGIFFKGAQEKEGYRLKKGLNYYPHGPLARVEYGNADNKVQGIDYAYTLQGWIKGINSTTLDSLRDMGKDGYGFVDNQYIISMNLIIS